MRRLLMEAGLSEEDLKHKDVPEVVDCIINHFGGVKAVQRELRKRGLLVLIPQKDFVEANTSFITSFFLQMKKIGI